ncbi:MAG: hypothetical protein JST62_13460 [Bacteroidetes bacterium]|nr:hypothetical protein [Bacteroidota bacterium]
MKGILKIYHPEETLKYNIKSSYCKAVYANEQHFLEVEIITDDSLDHIEDDSLHYRFPQLSFSVSNFPIAKEELLDQKFSVEDTEDDIYTDVNLYDDEDAYLYENELSFTTNEKDELTLIWNGKIDDFYTHTDLLIPFKLKCSFREEEMEIEE